jgi:DNA (cytosine-5)-methyltransferase 1
MRPGEIVVDSFAGGGGASLGISWALGRGPDVAINHDREAIALHAANHPDSTHYAEDVWRVDPVAACAGRPVGLMWLSPDCKHFSKAKGGRPVSPRVRGLAWIAVRWAAAVKPRVIVLENVEEFQTWGPVLAETGRPCPERKGRTFKAFVAKLRRLGYAIEWKELRACDYGTPTIRKRLFIIARCDGAPIVWPAPTHGKGRPSPWRTAAECIDWSIPCPSIFERKRPLAENTQRRIARGIQRFVIDNPRPFIVEIQNGSWGGSPISIDEPMRTVTAHPKGGGHALVTPFVAPLTHHDEARARSIEEPLATVTGANRGEQAVIAPILAGVGGRAGQSPERPLDRPHQTITAKADGALVAPMLVPRYGERGERWICADCRWTYFAGDLPVCGCSRCGSEKDPVHVPAQEPRVRSVEEPMATVVPGKNGASLAAAFITKHFGERPNGGRLASGADEPLPTVTARGTQLNLTLAHVEVMHGTGAGRPVDQPSPAVLAGGWHLAEVRSFLVAFYGNDKDGSNLNDPMRTLSTRDRFGLVTVDGIEYAIADIGMRMLAPRELYRAQGFPDSYRIEILFNGKPLTKTAQVRMCGNSVCPPLAEAIVRANVLERAADRQEIAA